MKSLLLILSLLFYTSYSYSSDCKGKTITTTIDRISWTTPSINLDETLKIFLGTKEGEVVDIFTSKRDAFTGLNVSIERVDDKDLRNAIIRWVFPRELKPSEYYLVLSLTDSGMELIKTQSTNQLTVSIRIDGQTRNASFNVYPNLSWNCKK